MRLSVQHQRGESRLGDLYQAGSFKALFPRPQGPALEAVALNTAGGITGGDSFELQAAVAEGAALSLTTQACERAYRAQPGEVGRMVTRLQVAPGARLSWLPQETILFEGSALRRSLCVDLSGDAECLLVEPLVLGRTAMGEVLHQVALRDRIEIRRDGRVLYLDQMALVGDVAAHLSHRFVGGGGGALASLVYVAPEVPALLSDLRALLPDTGGVSLIAEDALALRLLASDSFDLRRTLLPVLRHLNRGVLPRCWML